MIYIFYWSISHLLSCSRTHQLGLLSDPFLSCPASCLAAWSISFLEHNPSPVLKHKSSPVLFYNPSPLSSIRSLFLSCPVSCLAAWSYLSWSMAWPIPCYDPSPVLFYNPPPWYDIRFPSLSFSVFLSYCLTSLSCCMIFSVLIVQSISWFEA
jgi:hypothetical protein